MYKYLFISYHIISESSFQIQNPHFKFRILISNSESSFQFQNPHLNFRISISILDFSFQFQNPHFKALPEAPEGRQSGGSSPPGKGTAKQELLEMLLGTWTCLNSISSKKLGSEKEMERNKRNFFFHYQADL